MTNLLQDVQKKYQDSINRVMNECGVFFAFNNNQLQEGMLSHTLKEGDTYTRINGGCFIPTSNLARYTHDMQVCKDNFVHMIDHYNLHDAYIEYQLSNYESYYTYDIEDAKEALIGTYSDKQIWDVFNKNKALHYND